jgi:hypothetical protein
VRYAEPRPARTITIPTPSSSMAASSSSPPFDPVNANGAFGLQGERKRLWAATSSVPQSCLVTAQRGDVLIDLLVHKTRGIELTKALKDYTVASQTCRKEASSR